MGASEAQMTAREPMELTYVGHVGEILQLGGGKLSMSGGDPGEPRKPKGCEPACPPDK
jgi:hypothetical protein